MRPAPRCTTTLPIRVAAWGLLLAGIPALSACGTPPQLRQPRLEPYSPSPTTPAAPSTPPALPPTAGPGFPLPGQTTADPGEFTAVDCHGKPTSGQIISLLKRSPDLLGRNAKPTILTAPLCAGGWQYTVIQIPDREPLQVVSKGKPGDLTLVTAGTDVCNIPVRTEAPPAIQAQACTDGPVVFDGA